MLDQDEEINDKTVDDEIQDEQAELFEHFRFVVDKGQSMLRIDKFLACRIENASRTKVQYAAEAGNILVNGKLKNLSNCTILNLTRFLQQKGFTHISTKRWDTN